MIGTQIANYRVEAKLGEGGMGVVYRAIDVTLERPVALKLLSADLARDPALIERFRAEAKAQAKLDHTNIATLYSFLQVEGNCLIVMEYVDGETVEQMIRRRGPIPYEEAVPLFKQALLGIGFAHRMGVIHRDIKPSNLMVNRHGIVKVMDFGIAKVLGGQRLTRTGMQVGTVSYMSPEQIRNGPVDIRSDIYSLGVSLYEMLSGHVPFESDSDYQVMSDHVNTPPAPPTKYYPYIPRGIEEADLRALAKDPDARFRTVEEFGAALEHPEGAPAGASARPAVVAETVRPPSTVTTPPPLQWPAAVPGPTVAPRVWLTKRAVALGAGAVGLAVAVVAVVALYRPSAPLPSGEAARGVSGRVPAIVPETLSLQPSEHRADTVPSAGRTLGPLPPRRPAAAPPPPGAGAVRGGFGEMRADDGTFRVQVPAGWQKVGPAGLGWFSVAGRQGEWFAFTLQSVYQDSAALESFLDENRTRLSRDQLTLASRFVSPPLFPVGVVSELLPRVAGGAVQNVRILARQALPIQSTSPAMLVRYQYTLRPRGDAAYASVLPSVLRAEDQVPMEEVAVIQTLPLSGTSWSFLFGGVTAPRALFEQNRSRYGRIYQTLQFLPEGLTRSILLDREKAQQIAQAMNETMQHAAQAYAQLWEGPPVADAQGEGSPRAIAPTPTGRISSLNARVTAVRFYEAGNSGEVLEQRSYATTFRAATTRFVWVELSLGYPAPGRSVEAPVLCQYVRPDGTVMGHASWTIAIQSTWTSSYSWGSLGWDEPGNWGPGTYRVDCRADNQLIAQSSFRVF